jgi:flagellar hook-associated protein 1 FlgK
MSLTTSLSTAVQSLLAADGALQVTNNNIANANTPGYSRETVKLEQAAPEASGLGGGVVFAGYQSVRNELLQMQIQQQTQAQSGANAQLGTLQQLEPVFTTSTQDIGTAMSSLFSSLSNLSANPADSSARQGVLSAAATLATAFHTAANSLTSQQTGLNSQVTQDVAQINQLTQKIAALNPQIAAMKATGQDAGTVEDQQSQLIQQLSQLTDVAITQSNDGVTLTTGKGAPLVVAAQSYALQTTMGADGMQHVRDAAGNDITPSLQGGDLGGTVQARDQLIPGLLGQLDALAHQFAGAFNTAQAAGFDESGHAGTNFFTQPATVAGSAAGINVVVSDPSQIAASSDGSVGSNGNLVNFAAVQTTALPGGATPGDTYANLVYQVGSLTAHAQAESSAATTSLQQLNNQLNAVSGVSIDEESTNLIRYQQAYQAAAQVISTVNNLFTVTMNMMAG